MRLREGAGGSIDRDPVAVIHAALDAGESMAERTAWKICSDNRWWSAFGKK
ncbi:MAG: hypothetical protein H0U77_13610, partial [Nocardioidaceae bacterium]|nr:hypothetical protein [Nocardioidaceae bacterium]